MTTYFVYIIYSACADIYYVGETIDLTARILLHNNGQFVGSFTKRASDWKLFWSLECESRNHARSIEGHIKRMKSRKYYQSLRDYPEISDKLRSKYSME